MDAHDLTPERPALDDCDRCSMPWHACLCDPSRPRLQPTQEQIEEAREQRLAQTERGRGAP
jgi:hypothetical protein